MDFIDDVRTRSGRFATRIDHLTTEEATKTALVQPFIQMLGYEIFDPLEVIPEFTADVGLKKGERVDYALVLDGKPIILIEVKKYGSNLEEAHRSQLLRYFHGTEARFGILTDGIVYRFFTDLVETNKMDERPFFEFNMLDFTDAQVAELKRFTKSVFRVGEVLEAAKDLKYLADIKRVLAEEMVAPSPDFVGCIRRRVFDKPPSAKVKRQFDLRVRQAFGQFINDRINERLQSALAHEDAPVTPVKEKQAAEHGKRSPMAMVEQWASEHEGEIVLNDFARAAAADGTYPTFTQAYNAGFSATRRHLGLTKIAPGHYVIKDKAATPVDKQQEATAS